MNPQLNTAESYRIHCSSHSYVSYHSYCTSVLPIESLQLQMRISFPFLRANYLRTSLLIMKTRIFNLLYVGGTHERLVYTWYKHIFCMIAVLIVLFEANKKEEIWWKQYQNETATRKKQDSVTVSNAIARKINTDNENSYF